MKLPKKLDDEIWDYCRLNKITEVGEFTLKLVTQGFTVEKYGATPIERVVEKEVEKIIEVEKIVEVDKIVEVEKIVEVDKIIEVEVEKEVIREIKVTDAEETNKLLVELEAAQNSERVHKKSINALINEKKGFSDKIIELEAKVSDDTESKKLINKLKEKETEISKLKLENRELKEKLNSRDIYGEG
jgi:cell shape-determining protein MreC